MKASIEKRIHLTKKVIANKGISEDKRNRYEAKLAYLESLRKQEIEKGVKIRFTKITGYREEI